MKRTFKGHCSITRSTIECVVTDDIFITRYAYDETTEEAEKRTGHSIDKNSFPNGEIKGCVWKECAQNIKDMGWSSADEFIKKRMNRYKEVKA